jgi:hypothetical protein
MTAPAVLLVAAATAGGHNECGGSTQCIMWRSGRQTAMLRLGSQTSFCEHGLPANAMPANANWRLSRCG